MSTALIIHRAGPQVTVQDLGRSGTLGLGLSRGGAMDRLAIYEGAALLGQDPSCAVLEMAGMGVVVVATCDTRIALTGAEMTVTLDGTPLRWNACHTLPKGARLDIGGVRAGNYGYLHIAGGIQTAPIMGSRSAHLAGGVGACVSAGDHLPILADTGGDTGLGLSPSERCSGGTLRVVAGPQTALFQAEMLERFEQTAFARDPRSNRMGVKLTYDGDRFGAADGRSIVSEVVVPGDIQITGDGTPYILTAESQTTGGYPRIGTVIPSDMPKAVQTPAGANLRFQFIDLEVALEVEARDVSARQALKSQLKRLVRDPHDIRDLLSYQLISGVVSGSEEEPK